MKKGIQIRSANDKDVDLILSLILELAEHEGLTDQVTATPQVLVETLFGPASISEAQLVYYKGEVVGYFISSLKIETYTGKNEIYLQDIYVRPNYRRKGIGRAIMAYMARFAVEKGATWVEWVVVDSNNDALKFYKSLGAETIAYLNILRIEGSSLGKLAGEDIHRRQK